MKQQLRFALSPRCFFVFLLGHLAFFSQGQATLPEVKIDFNVLNRPAAEAQEPGYTPWVVSKPLTDTLTVNGITFIVKKGPRGATLNATYYKAGIQTGVYNVRFTDDGLTVKDGDAASGASIYLIIKGLPEGVHSLVTYHNMVDALLPNNICPMDVYVDSVLVVDNLIPTVRLEKLTEVSTAELQITAQANKDVVILFKADTTGTQATKNIFLNGFQLNGVNAGKKSRSPIPSHMEEHLAVPIGGNFLLRWAGSPAALSHDVYFGTDSAAVANATRTSPLYKGNKAAADTSYNATNLYSMLTYYWRIDEVTATTTYKGSIWEFRTRQLAFADAEGHGKYARGGRGGKVVEVTNLNDAGPGSFREAVTNPVGPRTIVFNVSGMIQLQSRLVLSDPYVYVAGQTAPGKGICIRSAPFGITGNDAIVRFMRVRIGGGTTYDGMGLTGCNYSIMDHSSISWTIDEAFSSRGAKNITLQRTLISEALNVAGHQNYPAGTAHGYAATIGGDTGSYHHNLLAHCYGRNWSLGGGLDAAGYLAGTMDIVNNVVYNWGTRTTDGGTKQLNFVNNYYKTGAGSTIFVALSMDHEGIGLGTQRAYFNGNVMPGRFDETNQTIGRRTTYSNGDTSSYQTFVDAPFFQSDITTQTAGNAYKNVLSDVGAALPVLDDHDIRMVNETLTGTYSVTGSVSGKKGFPDNEADAGGYENYPAETRALNWDSDHDGMPDWWERFKGFNTKSTANDFSESNADVDLNGYNNLDDYLEWMANPHYFGSAGVAILVDLKLLARGYTSSPSFIISHMVNATVTVNASGIATITPLAKGLGSFKFSVTDGAGSTMTRLVNFASGAIYNTPPIAFTGCPNVNLLIARTGYNMYNNEPLNLYNLDTTNGKATIISGGPLLDPATNKNFELNGAGLNVLDGFVYGIRDTINAAGTAQAAMLYRVGSNYGNDLLGTLPVPSLSNGENFAVVNPSAGGFDDQGNYFYTGIAGVYSLPNKTFSPSSYYIGKLSNISALSSGMGSLTATWTKIDFNNAPAAYKSSIYNMISSASGASASTSFQDLTYSNLYKSIYVYAAYNNGSAYSGQLFSINPTTGLATFYANPSVFGSASNEVAGISTTASGNLLVLTTNGDIYKPAMAGSGDFTSTLVKVGASGVAGILRGDLASCGVGSVTLPPSLPSSIIVSLPNGINAAPNPAQGVTTISVNQILTNATVRLVGIAGNVIVERSGISGYNFQMDMSGKPGGLYTIEVVQGGNTQILKIMKL